MGTSEHYGQALASQRVGQFIGSVGRGSPHTNADQVSVYGFRCMLMILVIDRDLVL
jgi:hypothetical protein